MREIRALVTVLAVIVALAAGLIFAITRSERRIGEATAERDAARAEALAAGVALQRAEADRDSLAALFAPLRLASRNAGAAHDAGRVAELARSLDSLRSLGAARPETVTVTLTLGAIDTTVTALNSCRVALPVCEKLAAAEGRRADAAVAETEAVRKELAAEMSLAHRPWTALGAVAASDGIGAFLDRDLWRLRLGGSIVAARREGVITGARIEIRVGVRF